MCKNKGTDHLDRGMQEIIRIEAKTPFRIVQKPEEEEDLPEAAVDEEEKMSYIIIRIDEPPSPAEPPEEEPPEEVPLEEVPPEDEPPEDEEEEEEEEEDEKEKDEKEEEKEEEEEEKDEKKEEEKEEEEEEDDTNIGIAKDSSDSPATDTSQRHSEPSVVGGGGRACGGVGYGEAAEATSGIDSERSASWEPYYPPPPASSSSPRSSAESRAFCVQSHSGQGSTGGGGGGEAALQPESSTASTGDSRGNVENGGSCGGFGSKRKWGG